MDHIKLCLNDFADLYKSMDNEHVKRLKRGKIENGK